MKGTTDILNTELVTKNSLVLLKTLTLLQAMVE